MSDSRPDVTILLVSWNTHDATRRCLESLRQAVTDDLGCEIIAVDNGSRDGSFELLAAWPDVRVLRNDTNVGHSAAINQAFRRARGELILLLNSDIRLERGALSALVAFLRQHPDAAGVAPLYPDDTKRHYSRVPTLTGALALYGRMRRLPFFRAAYRDLIMAGEDFSSPRPVPMPSAACLLLRRTVLGRNAIFDERLPLHWNDIHLAYRLGAQGLTLWMTPKSTVTHLVGASRRLLSPDVDGRAFLGGMSGYLHLTQPTYRVRIFQVVMMAYWLGRRLAGRHGPYHPDLRTMLACLRGDPGPLPDTALESAQAKPTSQGQSETGATRC